MSSLLYSTRVMFVFDLPAYEEKKYLMPFQMETVRMAKSQPNKNQPERSYLSEAHLSLSCVSCETYLRFRYRNNAQDSWDTASATRTRNMHHSSLF